MRNQIVSKEEIIIAAEKVIKEKGVKACSIRNLSKELGVAVGTTYNYFESHSALLEAVFSHSWANTLKRLEKVVTTNLPLNDKVTNFFKVIDQDIADRNGIGKELLKQPIEVTLIEQSKSANFRNIVDLLVSLLKECKNNKDLSKEVLRMNAKWIILGHISFGDRDDIDIFYQEVLKRFF